MKLKSKTRVGGKIVKVHDEPKTPYQRLIDCHHVSQEEKLALMARLEHLNPFRLKDELENKLKWYFKIVDIRKKQSKAVGL